MGLVYKIPAEVIQDIYYKVRQIRHPMVAYTGDMESMANLAVMSMKSNADMIIERIETDIFKDGKS